MKYTKLIAACLAMTSLSVWAHGNSLKLLAAQRANFTVEQVIAQESADKNTFIVELEVDDHKNQASYEVEIINLKTGQKIERQISMQDGSVLDEEIDSLKVLGINRLDDGDQAALTELKNSEFDLAKSVSLIKEKYNASVIELELNNKKGITFYKFKLLGEQGRKRVIVDIQTGNIIPSMKH